jgi:hypothetical protein
MMPRQTTRMHIIQQGDKLRPAIYQDAIYRQIRYHGYYTFGEGKGPSTVRIWRVCNVEGEPTYDETFSTLTQAWAYVHNVSASNLHNPPTLPLIPTPDPEPEPESEKNSLFDDVPDDFLRFRCPHCAGLIVGLVGRG